MKTDMPGAGGQDLPLRFRLVNLIPTIALVLFVLAIVSLGPPFQDPELKNFLASVGRLNLVQLGVISLFALFIALILSPFQLSLVRLIEGYWTTTRFTDAMSEIGKEVQRRRLQQLSAYNSGRFPPPSPTRRIGGQVVEDQGRASRESARQERLQRVAAGRLGTYPAADDLLPTRLGNVLRAAERQAGERYGFDTVTVWPHLYPYLSPSLASALANARDQLDTAVRFCAVLLLATAIATVLLAVHGWWLLVPVATAALAWLAYWAAVRAADDYGRLLRVAFDLHRFDLVRGLHLPLPEDPEQETQLNDRITRFLAGEQIDLKEMGVTGYQHDPDKPPRRPNWRARLRRLGTRLVSWLRRRLPRPGGSEESK